jgi:hypothetical protein
MAGLERRMRRPLFEPRRQGLVAADGGVRDVGDRAGDALDGARVGAAGQAGDPFVGGGVENRGVAVRVEQASISAAAAASRATP